MPAETPAQPPRQQLAELCECVVCCDGEHPGYCRNCAGWGEVDGKPCDYCAGDLDISGRPSGICPKCRGDWEKPEFLIGQVMALHGALRAADAAPVDLGTVRKDAATVTQLLELGDSRLLADEGPANGLLPRLDLKEWAAVYRACKRIAAASGGGGGGRGEGR